MFTKKNMIMIAIMAIFVLGTAVLLAETVIFSGNPDASASNIQGKVYFWDYDIGAYVLVGQGHPVHVKLFYDDDQGANSNQLFDEEIVYTDANSFYQHDFDDSGGNSNYCDKVEVIYNGSHYSEYYDGIVRIDIYYKESVYDPTIPGGE